VHPRQNLGYAYVQMQKKTWHVQKIKITNNLACKVLYCKKIIIQVSFRRDLKTFLFDFVYEHQDTGTD